MLFLTEDMKTSDSNYSKRQYSFHWSILAGSISSHYSLSPAFVHYYSFNRCWSTEASSTELCIAEEKAE